MPATGQQAIRSEQYAFPLPLRAQQVRPAIAKVEVQPCAAASQKLIRTAATVVVLTACVTTASREMSLRTRPIARVEEEVGEEVTTLTELAREGSVLERSSALWSSLASLSVPV